MLPRALRGFTLIEILVALLIFSIIGVISSQLMSQTIRANETLRERGTRLADIHRVFQTMQRDVMQLNTRGIRDEYGDKQPNLIISTGGAIEFTRNGWRNPLQLPRAESQRVAYLVQDNTLLRAYWPVLDRAQDSEAAYQSMLEQVEAIEFVAVDNFGNEHAYWPQPSLPPEIKIVGLIARVDLPSLGVVERIWEVLDG